eukprot:1084345-Rhodomonas_salina.3
MDSRGQRRKDTRDPQQRRGETLPQNEKRKRSGSAGKTWRDREKGKEGEGEEKGAREGEVTSPKRNRTSRSG